MRPVSVPALQLGSPARPATGSETTATGSGGGAAGGDSSSDTSIIGGAMRNVFRTVIRVFRLDKVVLGSLPRRVPTRAIAKNADAFGQLYDISSELLNAHGELKSHSRNTKSQDMLAYARRGAHLAALAAPPIVKSAVLGSILFSSFENLESSMYHHWGDIGVIDDTVRDGNVEDDTRVMLPSLLALAAGAGSGCLHGFAYTLWDSTSTFLTSHSTNEMPARTFRAVVPGTMLSHTFVHSVLFGSYEVTKRSALVLIGLNTGHDTSRVEGAACVLLGGAAAGVLSEMASAITLPLEEIGIAAYLKSLSKTSTPGNKDCVKVSPPKFNPAFLKGIGPSVVSTMIGFVAYEYAKDIYFNSDHGDE